MNTDDNVQGDDENAADFLAGFNEGDPVVGEAKPAPAAPASDDQVDDANPDDQGDQGGGENIQSQGVDTPDNGGQVSPNAPQLDLNALPEDLRQQVGQILEERNQLQIHYKELHNRVAPVQRQLAAAEIALAQRQQVQQPQPPQKPAGAMAQFMAQFETPEWKDYEGLFPEDAALHKRNQVKLAETFDSRFNQFEEMFGAQAQVLQQIEADRLRTAQANEIATLEQAHPDWRSINETEEFWNWLDGKNSLWGFRDESDRNQRLQNREFVSSVLDLYKAQAGGGFTPQAEQGGPVVTAPAQRGTRRKDPIMNLAAAPSLRGSGIPRGNGGGVTEADEFAAGYNSTD